jgi:hypothetical protein
MPSCFIPNDRFGSRRTTALHSFLLTLNLFRPDTELNAKPFAFDRRFVMNIKSSILLLTLALATASTVQAKTVLVDEHHAKTEHVISHHVNAKQTAAQKKVVAKKTALARAKAQKAKAHLIAHKAQNKALYSRYSSYKNDHRYYWNGSRWVLHARYR